MPRKLPKNVRAERSRHGKTVYYFRQGHGARIRLPGKPGSSEFSEAVAAARGSGLAPARPTLARPSFERSRRGEAGRAISRIYRGAKVRASKRGYAFDLDENWLLDLGDKQGFCCALTGIPFYMADRPERSRINPYAPSLDRIDCQGGYTKDNVRLVAFAVNVMLNDWGEEIFARVANGYRHWRGEKTRTLFPNLLQEVRAAKEIRK